MKLKRMRRAIARTAHTTHEEKRALSWRHTSRPHHAGWGGGILTGATRETLCVRLGVSGVPERTKHDADGADETRQPAQHLMRAGKVEMGHVIIDGENGPERFGHGDLLVCPASFA